MKKKVNIKKKYCHICNSSKILKIIDFGFVGLAGAFLKKKKFCPKKNTE